MKFQDIITDYLKDKGFTVNVWNGRGGRGRINFRLPPNKNNYRLVPKGSGVVELRRANLHIRSGKNQFFYEPDNILLLTIDIHNPHDTQAFYDWVEELMIKTKVSRG